MSPYSKMVACVLSLSLYTTMALGKASPGTRSRTNEKMARAAALKRAAALSLNQQYYVVAFEDGSLATFSSVTGERVFIYCWDQNPAQVDRLPAEELSFNPKLSQDGSVLFHQVGPNMIATDMATCKTLQVIPL